MHLFILITLTMIAFAMNSVLNRAAVDGGHADATAFAMVRVLAGVVVLFMVMSVRRRGRLEVTSLRRWGGGLALAVYMIGFSLAYLSLDAGIGALILFGTVQICLFLQASMSGMQPTRAQIIGACVAFVGLLIALVPSTDASASFSGALFMLAAGLGWAAYTLAGRGARDPVAATTSHFLLCLPFIVLLLTQPGQFMTPTGWGLAILSGGVTSGLGYALWYHVLPALPGARAAIVQLSVPVLAIALGAVLLGEPIGFKVVLSALLVLGGIGYALRSHN